MKKFKLFIFVISFILIFVNTLNAKNLKQINKMKRVFSQTIKDLINK